MEDRTEDGSPLPSMVASDEANYAEAQGLYEESLAIQRDIGDASGMAHSLNNLGSIAAKQNDYVAAGIRYS